MYEKKVIIHKTPDLAKMQAVVIDQRTIIYIAIDADPKEAKQRYMSRPNAYKKP